MIVYGTSKGIALQNGRVRNVACPECQTDTAMDYAIFGRYAHLYWIPFFPIGKHSIAVCTTCQTDFEIKNLRSEIKKKFDRETQKQRARMPVWFFSGSIVVALFIGYIAYSANETENLAQNYAHHPKPGDVYRVTADPGFYSTYKVSKVFKDSLYVFANDLQTDRRTGIDEINTPAHYKELYAFARKEIETMQKDGRIYQIDRP
jgi:hypothetical protein